MKKKTPVEKVRPKNGCARCIWWMQGQNNSWGRCALYRSRTWWQAPPCQEYELDPEVLDKIVVYQEDL